jgi:hypothetical protein
MNEQLMRDCLRMFQERASYYERIWLDNYHHRGYNNVESLAKSDAYQNAATMLRYALDGDKETLAQFDYFGEDE